MLEIQVRLLVEWQIELVANMTVVFRSGAAYASILTLQAARGLLESALLALVADESRRTVARFVLGLRTNAVIHTEGQLLFHPLDGIAKRSRTILAKLASKRNLSQIGMVTIAVVMLAPILENFLRALRPIVAVEHIVVSAIALALFYLNVAPQTSKPLGTNAVHQILVTAEILQYAFQSVRVALRIYEGILGLVHVLAVIFEPMLALTSVLALQRAVLGLGSIVIGNVILTVRSVEALCALAFLVNISGAGV